MAKVQLINSSIKKSDMKTCKYCKESISADASKCPKCQSYQNFWGHPLFWIVLMITFLFLPPYFFSSSFNDRADYAEYADKITLTVLSMDTLHYGKDKEHKSLNIIIELENNSKEEWQQADYEIEYHSKDGKLVNVERQSAFSFKLRPHSTAKTSIKTPIYDDYADSKVTVKLDNMEAVW